MKRTALLIACWTGAFLAPAPWMRAADASPQPVYILLTASVNDDINWDVSQERLRRTITALGKYRKDHPAMAATVYFSGAMSEALSEYNSQDHLLDFVRAAIRQGAVQPGYDGSDEPTYAHRAMLDFSQAKTPEDRWMARVNSARELLTGARDPLTGAPQPGKSGGLKRMQEVFGPAAMIRGVVLQMPNVWGPIDEVGTDSEIVNVLRQLSPDAVLTGLPDADLAHTSGSQFRPWANTFTKMMSPASNTSPEMYWQEDKLRVADTSMLDARTFRAEDGVEKLKAALAGLDRSKVRILHVELGGQRIYVKPLVRPMPRIILPLAWAYSHPASPAFPENLSFPKADVEANYARQDEVLNFLASAFLPANPGSRFITPADVKKMAKPGWGYDIAFENLRQSVVDVLKEWGDGTTPPAYLKVQDRYLSMADMFAVFSDALAQQSRSGRFPASIHVGRVFGPVLTDSPRVPVTGEVTEASVAAICAKMTGALHDDSWAALPHNAIPSPVTIGDLSVTPAQFLRLMAEALVAPSPQTKLTIKPVDTFAGKVMTFYNRRPHTDLGGTWTFKPAVVVAAAGAR